MRQSHGLSTLVNWEGWGVEACVHLDNELHREADCKDDFEHKENSAVSVAGVLHRQSNAAHDDQEHDLRGGRARAMCCLFRVSAAFGWHVEPATTTPRLGATYNVVKCDLDLLPPQVKVDEHTRGDQTEAPLAQE